MKKKTQYFQKNDIRLTRMYFSTPMEVIARIMILIVQAVMLGVIIIVSTSLAMIATSKLPIPSVFNNFGLADGIFRGLTIVISVFGIIFSLIFVIPILIVSNIKLLKLTGIIFNTLGCIFVLLMLGLSIIAYLYIPVRLNLPGVIMAGICMLMLFLGSFLLWLSAIRQQKRINIAVCESLDFSSKLNIVESEVALIKKTENIKTINKETSAKLVKKMHFVFLNNQPVLKKLNKNFIDYTAKSLGKYELNKKKQIHPLPYQYNIESSKYYFSTKIETIARSLIVFSQLLLIVVALIYIPTLGKIGLKFIISLLSKFKTPFTDQILKICWKIVIGIIILLAILWVITLFFIIIPILITKTLKTVNIWINIVSIVGNINFYSIIVLAILKFIYVKNSFNWLNINPFVLLLITIFAFCCFILGCLFLKSDCKKYQTKLENEISNKIRELS